MRRNLTTPAGYKITGIEDHPIYNIIKAEIVKKDNTCPKCSATLIRHGTRNHTIADIPQNKKPTRIKIRKIRYKCYKCLHTFVEPLPDPQIGKLTTRLIQFIKEELKTKTRQQVIKETGISYATIMYIERDIPRPTQDTKIIRNDLQNLRDKLYTNLPSGEIHAFDLLKIIKEHISDLDNVIEKIKK